MKDLLLLSDLEPMPQEIIRALEDGADYQPDWRHLQVQQYVKNIYHEDAEPLRRTRLNQILKQESDALVRDLLLFHYGRRPRNYEAIVYAVRCWRDNIRTLSASRIKTMVIAKGSAERIAHEMGTTEDKIDTFEKLFFDARRYLERRGWLAGICSQVAGPEAVSAAESRWFRIAFRRGWPGVEEVVLGHVPKSGERTLQHAASVLLGRVDDYCVDLEASGAALTEKDVKALLSVARIHALGLPYLWENPVVEQAPSTNSPATEAVAQLATAGRDRLRLVLKTVMDAAEAKAKALADESEKPNFEPNKPEKEVQIAKIPLDPQRTGSESYS